MKAKEIEKRLINVERKYRQLEYMMDLDGSTKRTIEAMEDAYKREKELNEATCNNLKAIAIKKIENEKKEEVKYETKIPLFEIGELEYFDCNMQSIIESLLKTKLKEKDHILLQRIIKKQEEQIKTLKNNWNKLKKWIKEYQNGTGLSEYETGISDALYDTLKKMKALQGSDKE